VGKVSGGQQHIRHVTSLSSSSPSKITIQIRELGIIYSLLESKHLILNS
jgi:hypothetical protein